MNELVNALTQVLAQYGGGAIPAQANMGQQSQQQFNANHAQQFKQKLPFGVVDTDYRGVYVAESVEHLISWDEHVIAPDGGTFEGLKVHYIGQKANNPSDKSYSQRKAFTARFEISIASGKNPMNEVINVFIKSEKDYVQYLDAQKWSHALETVEFKSEMDDEPDRKFRLHMIRFEGELISDDVRRKCTNILKNIGGAYELFIGGEKVKLD